MQKFIPSRETVAAVTKIATILVSTVAVNVAAQIATERIHEALSNDN